MKTFKITKNSQYIQSIQLDKGTYTYSCNVKSDATVLTIAFQNEKGVWTDFEIPILSGMWNKKAKLTFELKEKMVNFDLCKYASNESKVYVQAPMLEEGTNASTPKSSDLDDLEEIDNNKSQIKAFNLAFEDLENYIDGAFKDGVIDSAEATTIAQLIKTVESENDKMLATYDKLFLNSYLEGTAKSSLQQNKITFVGAVNDVITAINTAIADNKITPTERTNVNNKFNAYKTALADFSTAIENANKAIQDKLNDLSIDRTADAEQAAKLYADTKAEAERIIAEAYADGIVTTEEQARIDDVNTKLQLAKEYADAQDLLLKAQQEAYADGIVTASEQATINTAKAYADLKKTESDAYADGIVSAEEARAIADAQAKYEQAKAYADAQDELLDGKIDDALDNASQAQADAIMARSVTDQFGTIQNGGLISPVTILLRELNTLIETAGLTGHQGENRDQPAFWSGGTYADAIAGLAKAIIRHDGTSKFTDTEIEGKVTATSGSFKGKIEATEGDIGGINIAETHIGSTATVGTLNKSSIFLSTSKVEMSETSSISGGIHFKKSTVTSDSVKVSRQRIGYTEESIEIKFDGIYKNGVKIL